MPMQHPDLNKEVNIRKLSYSKFNHITRNFNKDKKSMYKNKKSNMIKNLRIKRYV